MRTYFLLVALVALALGPLATTADAQASSMDDVRLFSSSFGIVPIGPIGPMVRDAQVGSGPYAELGGHYLDFDSFSHISLALTGGVPIQEVFELGAQVAFSSIDPEGDFDGESGIDDALVYGRFNVMNESQTKLAVGGLVTLPIGDEDIGAGDDVHFGFFSAIRHYVSDELGITGTVGLDLIEVGEDRETNLVLGAGTIFAVSDGLHLVPEFQYQTELEYFALSGGADYEISNAARLRGSLQLGLDDGAPDFGVTAGVLFGFGQ